MTTSKLVRSPVVHRSAAIAVAAFLLAAGARQAGATPAGAASAAAAGATATSSAACPDQVHISLGRMSVSGGMVRIAFSTDAHGCPAAQPARLHIHQNLVSSPQAGSDPVHQWNADFLIGADHDDGVTVPLLESADGKCFVQVDAHASGQTRGQFFPTTTCSSAPPSSPASSSPVPSSTAPSSPASSSSTSTSAVATSTAQTSTAPASSSAAPSTTSQSVLPESTSRTGATTTFVPVGQVVQSPPAGSLASTGTRTVLPVGVGALFLIAGAWLMSAGRRPRRH